MSGYRTIVADPPWPLAWNRDGTGHLPYGTMSLQEIAGLPVNGAANHQAHLWLWTTATFLYDAPAVARAWGFQPLYTLTWVKAGLGVGGRFRHTTEFVLFCETGPQLPITRRDLPTHYAWPRGEHSSKPDAFYDLVEAVSPQPRLELFARRARFGWEYWGDQALNNGRLAGQMQLDVLEACEVEA